LKFIGAGLIAGRFTENSEAFLLLIAAELFFALPFAAFIKSPSGKDFVLGIVATPGAGKKVFRR
jgi:hypothetical protein